MKTYKDRMLITMPENRSDALRI